MEIDKKQHRNSNGILSEQGELEGRIEFLPIEEWFMKNKLPPFLFNYVEDVGGPTAGNWDIRITEQSGEGMSRDNQSGNIVDLNGGKVEGIIAFWVESCLSEENHRRLCEAFKLKVEAIAIHCVE